MKNLVWRVWFWVKETWMHLSGRDTVSLTIRLKDLNYRRFERACLLVGLDPDRVRQGEQDLQEAEIGDVRDTGPELVRLLCRNDEVVLDVLGRADAPVAEHLCAQLLTRFFFRCMKKWRRQIESYSIMPSGPASPLFSTNGAPSKKP
jgi:hypothetical protein